MAAGRENCVAVWAIADLHLSFADPRKAMDRYGALWVAHWKRIEEHWRASVSAGDLVLIPGDISWATTLEEARPDLAWIDRLPGQKLLMRGNHDYWWPQSRSRLHAAMPPSCHALRHDVFLGDDFAVAGTRLWDIPGISFDHLIQWYGQPATAGHDLTQPESSEDALLRAGSPSRPFTSDDARILRREMDRLRRSLEMLPRDRRTRICMTHYPPVSAELDLSEASQLIAAHGVQTAVFGHLHNVTKDWPLFGEHFATRYVLTSCDYIGFQPLRILG